MYTEQMNRSFILLFTCLVTACAGPQTVYPKPEESFVQAERVAVQRIQIQEAIARDARVWSLLQPLLDANKMFCKDRLAYRLPMRQQDKATLKKLMKGFSEKQIRQAGFDKLSVTASASKTIKPGDIIMAINGEHVQGDRRKLGRQLALLNQKWKTKEELESATAKREAENKVVRLTIERDGKQFDQQVPLSEQCTIAMRTSISPEINAFASGFSITVHAGLINALDNDRDLALVLAHELGHSLGLHTRKLTLNAFTSGFVVWGPVTAITAGIGDIVLQPISEVLTGSPERPLAYLTGAATAGALRTREFEREADYLGLYFLARAGFEIGGADEMYQVLTLLSPWSTFGYRSHPTVPERRLMIRQTIDEIVSRQKKQDALIPYGWIVSDSSKEGAQQ